MEEYNLDNGLEGLEEFLRKTATAKYHQINKRLSLYVDYYNRQIHESNRSKDELEKIRVKLYQRINALKDELNKNAWEYPDAATDLGEFAVQKNGEKYIVNKGLEEKVNDRYKRVISSLEEKLKIVELFLQDQPQGPTNKTPSIAKEPMNYFDQFITDVQTVEIKVVEKYLTPTGYINDFLPSEMPDLPFPKKKYLDVSHYDQKKSNYEAEIKRLQQLALNEILKMQPQQITLQLKRLEQIESRFSKFWEQYSKHCENFRNGRFDRMYFELEVENLFIIPKYEDATITQEYLFDWQDAIMFKQGYLLGFVAQVKEVIGIKDENTEVSFANGGEDYIKPELLVRLKQIESEIHSQFTSWDKIKRAAWVELLLTKGYFLPEYKRYWRKNCAAFAKARYKIDIKNQLLTKDKNDRETHKKQLLRYFK